MELTPFTRRERQLMQRLFDMVPAQRTPLSERASPSELSNLLGNPKVVKRATVVTHLAEQYLRETFLTDGLAAYEAFLDEFADSLSVPSPSKKNVLPFPKQKQAVPQGGRQVASWRRPSFLPRLTESDLDDSDESDLDSGSPRKGFLSRAKQKKAVYDRIIQVYGDDSWKQVIKDLGDAIIALPDHHPFYAEIEEMEGALGSGSADASSESKGSLSLAESRRARAFLCALLKFIIRDEIGSSDVFVKESEESFGLYGPFHVIYLHLQDYLQKILSKKKDVLLFPSGLEVITTKGYEAALAASAKGKKKVEKEEWVPENVKAIIRTKIDFLLFLNPVDMFSKALDPVQTMVYQTVKTISAEKIGREALILDFGLTEDDLDALVDHPMGKTNFPDFLIDVSKLTPETRSRLQKAFLAGWNGSPQEVLEAQYWLIDVKSSLKATGGTDPRMQYFRLKRVRRYLRTKFVEFGGRPEVRDQLLELFAFDDTPHPTYGLRNAIFRFGPNDYRAFLTKRSAVELTPHEARLIANMFASGIAHELPEKPFESQAELNDWLKKAKKISGSGAAKGVLGVHEANWIQKVFTPKTKTLTIYQEVGAGSGTGAVYSFPSLSPNPNGGKLVLSHDIGPDTTKSYFTTFSLTQEDGEKKTPIAVLSFYSGSTVEYVRKYAPKAYISFKDGGYEEAIEEYENEIANLKRALKLFEDEEVQDALILKFETPLEFNALFKRKVKPKVAQAASKEKKVEAKDYRALYQKVNEVFPSLFPSEGSEEKNPGVLSQLRVPNPLSLESEQRLQTLLKNLRGRLAMIEDALKRKKVTRVETTLNGLYHYFLTRIPTDERGGNTILNEKVALFQARKKAPEFRHSQPIEIAFGIALPRDEKGNIDPETYYQEMVKHTTAIRQVVERNKPEEIKQVLQTFAVNPKDRTTWTKTVKEYEEAIAERQRIKNSGGTLDEIDIGLVDYDKQAYKEVAERLETLESGANLSFVRQKFRIKAISDFAKALPSDEWPLMWHWKSPNKGLALEFYKKSSRSFVPLHVLKNPRANIPERVRGRGRRVREEITRRYVWRTYVL